MREESVDRFNLFAALRDSLEAMSASNKYPRIFVRIRFKNTFILRRATKKQNKYLDKLPNLPNGQYSHVPR